MAGGFVRAEHQGLFVVEAEPKKLLQRLVKFTPPKVEKWIRAEETEGVGMAAKNAKRRNEEGRESGSGTEHLMGRGHRPSGANDVRSGHQCGRIDHRHAGEGIEIGRIEGQQMVQMTGFEHRHPSRVVDALAGDWEFLNQRQPFVENGR